MAESKTNLFRMRMRPSVRVVAEDIAETERRSIANYIEWLILRDAASRAPAIERQKETAAMT